MNRSAVALGFTVLLPTLGCSASAEPPTESTQAAESRGVEHPIDFPNKPREPRALATTTTLEYFGGPVISNPKVYFVSWGDPSGLNPVLTASPGGVVDFLTGITNSSYLDWLNEYDTFIKVPVGSHTGLQGSNQHIGRGNFAGSFTLTSIPSGNVTDAQIQATLDQAFTARTLPQPDATTIYAIYFPASVTITLPGSGSSCSSFGAYHFATTETTRHAAYYLVMPDCGFDFAGYTEVTSHELMEATTDAIPTPGSSPDFPQAWNDASGSEVGDLCEGTSGTVSTALGKFTVQGIWDEASQGCLVFRSNARDYNVSFPTNHASLTVGTPGSVTVKTATVAGAAQTLNLAVTVPPGVTATISPTRVLSGATATLTVTASKALSASQVIVRAYGTNGKTTQAHTAALLLHAK